MRRGYCSAVLQCVIEMEKILKRLRREQHYVENTAAEISVDLGVNCSISPEGTTSQTVIYEQGFV